MLGYDTLQNWFRTNFTLIQHHKYNLEVVENWMVWEKFVYLDMLSQHIKNEDDKARARANELKAMNRR
jgi:hypothetical protein